MVPPREGLGGEAGDVWIRSPFEVFLLCILCIPDPDPPLHKAISFWSQPYLCPISQSSEFTDLRSWGGGGFMGGEGGRGRDIPQMRQ